MKTKYIHAINQPKAKRKSLCIAALGAMFFGVSATSVLAADLITVYNQALISDPSFKASRAEWLAARENLPISRANLLPQISATGNLNRAYDKAEGPNAFVNGITKIKYYDNVAAYSLNLTQPIFNFSYWTSLWSTKAAVKSAEAKFFSSAQDLMFRTASAYFAVLQAQDELFFTREQKRAVGEQLYQQKQRYAVGLIPITDVNDAQANYDGIVAQEIAGQNDLQDQEEKLQEITGIRFMKLSTLITTLPLVSPVPQNIEQWVNKAVLQNYYLIAAKNDTLAARENVFTQASGHLPVLNATGGYQYEYDSNTGGTGAGGRTIGAVGGLSLSVPIFQGGATAAHTQQAGYQYQQAISVQEKTYRSVISETRQAYLGVMSGIGKIKADRQAVKSKASALVSTRNAYAAGMRTMVDVLQAESNLYNAEKVYAHDQYAYLLQTLSLKQQAGMLSAEDLQKINKWLHAEKRYAKKYGEQGNGKKEQQTQSKEMPVKEAPCKKTSAQEAAPAKQEVPAKQETPAKKETPVKQEASAKQETPVKQESPAKTGAPVNQEAPSTQDASLTNAVPIQKTPVKVHDIHDTLVK